MGLCYISSYIKSVYDNEIDVKLIDGSIISEKKMFREIREYKPDVVGISSVTANIKSAKYIASKIKEADPSVLCVTGGPHVSVRPGDVFPEFDLAVSGEGEIPFSD